MTRRIVRPPGNIDGYTPLAELDPHDHLDTHAVSMHTGYAFRTLRAWRSPGHRYYGRGPAYQAPLTSGRGHKGVYVVADVQDWMARWAAAGYRHPNTATGGWGHGAIQNP